MNFKDFKAKFSINLTEQQEEAVQAVEGPVLLLSVPGSGKTTVLVTRIGWMIYGCGIKPESILVLTYTVASARDMERRFASKFGEDLGSKVHFSTINSICQRIIYWYAKATGNTVFDFSDYSPKQAAFLSQAYTRTSGGYATESDLQDIRTQITYIKNMMLSNEQIDAMNEDLDYDIAKIYRGYREFMRQQHIMDYDDQLVYALVMLKSDRRVLEHVQSRFSYVLVDEAQDTSKIQHVIISMIAKRNDSDNLFMVGDEDQSIYGFRGAYPEALMSFGKVHKNSKVLLMEENFRSDAHIVRACERVINHNVLRHPKKLKASHAAKVPVKMVEVFTRGAQLNYLLKAASDLKEETAVLYRDNESIIPFVDMLEKHGVPYRIRKSELNFFTSRIVKDLTDIIHFAYDPTNTEAFMNIYFKVRTYLKKENARVLCGVSQSSGCTVFDAAYNSSLLKRRQLSSIEKVDSDFRHIVKLSGKDALSCILYSMGYLDYLERSKMDTRKLFALKKISEGTPDLRGFLTRLDFLNKTISEKENDPGVPLILSTIHSSKGLEYDNVYLIDVMDGVFPKAEKPPQKITDADKVTPEQEAYEEERRIFYVGATRAKKRLTIFTFKHASSTFANEMLK
ncbi:MAG: ATP-dependent helicase [bacterium LCO1.1]|uniref:DNA 3'-5' helicase n=1 Tax=Candidatus Weimeria bifida TaxID=2599074 RepID=A0A6N7IZV9_9FIRM|nr:ATP-dependent helicase [Candidatus Weimeria bifida]